MQWNRLKISTKIKLSFIVPAALTAGAGAYTFQINSPVFWIMMSAAVAVSVTGFCLLRSVIGPVKDLVNAAEKLAAGDFTVEISKSAKNEFGYLAHALNQAIHKISSALNHVQSSAGGLASSSEQLSGSALIIADGSREQSSRTSQVATASHEMSSSIGDVARNVSGAAETARKANKEAARVSGIVEETITSINSIADTTRETSQVVAILGSRSQDVGNIIKVIDDIANQTNLLALNAAIEAARAGEQGRGFAVVADEVRKLAEKTTAATKEIGETIGIIQEDTTKALASMDDEINAVEKGVRFTKDAGAALKEIIAQVEELSFVIQQIASTTEEQSTAADQISGDIETIAEITKGTSAGAEEVARASHNIAQLASHLQSITAGFKVNGKTAHATDSVNSEPQHEKNAGDNGARS